MTDLTAPDSDPVAVALLLPAVQSAREAARSKEAEADSFLFGSPKPEGYIPSPDIDFLVLSYSFGGQPDDLTARVELPPEEPAGEPVHSADAGDFF